MYIKSATKILFFLFLIFSSVKSTGQLKYNFERLTTENGLPTNAIKGLQFDDKNRFLWVATESGIVRYNGHDFQSFGDNNNSALNGRIVFFVKSNNGKLFGKLMDERVFVIKGNNAVIDESIQKMDDENSLLNYKYDLHPKIKQNATFPIELRDIKVGSDIYVKYEYSLFKYDNNKFYTIKDTIEFENEFTIDNTLFIVKKNGVIYKANIEKNELNLTKVFELYREFKYDVKNIFTKVKIFQNHPSETAYLVQGEKLYSIIYENFKLKFNLITDQLPKNEFIKYVQIDNVTNAIYIGTDNRGILVGRPQYFKRILPNNSIDGVSASAYAQLELNNGNIQINGGQMFGNTTKSLYNVFYKSAESATFISRDSILYMTNSDGIVEYDLKINKIRSIHKENTSLRNCFIQIQNKIYSFSEIGIAVKNSNWDFILKFNKMPFNFIVYSLMQINNNEILVATTDGLYKYKIKENAFTMFFRDTEKSNFRTIYNLNGFYLIGTYGGGIYMYRNDSIRKLPLDQNRYLNYTHCFIQDNKQNVWASTNKGLFMSPASSLIDFWTKGPGNIKFKYFGKNDGIDELEMNGGCTPCAIKLKNGKFSFPGIDGLIQFNPDSIPETNIQPKVFVDKLIVDNKLINLSQFKNTFESGVKNIEVHLGISGMLSQENVMLEYKFDNEDWIRLNVNDAIITYSNPEFGSHIFSIRLRNTINKNWEKVDYPFVIKYPWYLNPYIFVIYLLLGFALVRLYIHFNTIIYQRRQKLLEKEVDAKTNSLNKINEVLIKRNQAKDHVIAIMNHDILTPLKYLHITAKNIVENIHDENAKKSINQIAKTSKDLEYLTSNMLNWVKFESVENFPEKQSINLYTLVNELVEFVSPFNHNLNVSIVNNIPNNLIINNWPDSLRVLLYNLVVNAINNSNNGEISLNYVSSSTGYKIVVKDSGMGMSESMVLYLIHGKAKDEVEQIPRYKKGNGVGFQIIRNIINLMNATIEIDSIENVGTSVSISFVE